MKKLLLIFLCLFAVTAYAQSEIHSKNKHHERVKEITRIQADQLELNEMERLRLLRVNEKTLPLVFESKTEEEMIAVFSVYQVRLSYILKAEQVAQLSSKLEVITVN